jgi:hypothetical protein
MQWPNVPWALVRFPCQSERLATATNSNILSILQICSMQHTVKKTALGQATLWHTTSHIFLLYSKPISTALWLPAFILMCELIYLLMTVIMKWFIIHFRAIWPLSSMWTLMCVQSSLITEWLITHITAIWLLPTMYTQSDNYFPKQMLLQ